MRTKNVTVILLVSFAAAFATMSPVTQAESVWTCDDAVVNLAAVLATVADGGPIPQQVIDAVSVAAPLCAARMDAPAIEDLTAAASTCASSATPYSARSANMKIWISALTEVKVFDEIGQGKITVSSGKVYYDHKGNAASFQGTSSGTGHITVGVRHAATGASASATCNWWNNEVCAGSGAARVSGPYTLRATGSAAPFC